MEQPTHYTPMQTHEVTYDSTYAYSVLSEINERLESRGFAATNMRSFQKSLNDGLGDRFVIHFYDGLPVDITRDFDAYF